MAKVDAGDQALVQGTQLQHLVQVSQLINLSHGLRTQGDVTESPVITGGNHRPQAVPGNVQRLLPGALHQCPGVDHNPLRPHLVGHQAGRGNVADGLLQGLRVGVCQVNEVWGVEGQGNSRLLCPLPQLSCGVRPHMDALSALILIAAKAQPRDPARGVQGGLILLGKAVGIARGAKFRAHRNGLLLPSRRKGVSAA